MPLKLKDIHKGTVVGFNNSGKPLGERKDLHLLAIASRRNPNLEQYFDELPTDDELDEMQAKHFEEMQAKKSRAKKTGAQALSQLKNKNIPVKVVETTNKENK